VQGIMTLCFTSSRDGWYNNHYHPSSKCWNISYFETQIQVNFIFQKKVHFMLQKIWGLRMLLC